MGEELIQLRQLIEDNPDFLDPELEVDTELLIGSLTTKEVSSSFGDPEYF